MADWQAGDLALCVRVTHPAFPRQRSKRLRIGVVYTVRKVGRPHMKLDGERALVLAEVQPRLSGRGFLESLFVKVTPPAADEWDRETIALLNGNRVPAPADRGLVSQGGGR